MRRRFEVWLLAGALATVLPTAPAIAQTNVQLVDANGAPIVGADLFTQINGIKNRGGTTNERGETSVTDTRITPGTEMFVYVRVCRDGKPVVIAVPRDERLEPEDDCEDNLAGVFPWGDEITITQTGAGYTLARRSAREGGGLSWYGSVSYDLFRFAEVDFDSGLTAADTWSSGGGLYAGVAVGRHLWAGVGGHIINVDREISIDGSRTNRDYHAYQLGGNVRAHWGMRLQPYGLLGVYYDWDKGDFPRVQDVFSIAPATGLAAAAQDEGEEERTHESWRWEVGGGAVYWWAPRFGLDTTIAYSPANKGEDDADEHVRVSVGLIYNGGVVCGGQCGGRR